MSGDEINIKISAHIADKYYDYLCGAHCGGDEDINRKIAECDQTARSFIQKLAVGQSDYVFDDLRMPKDNAFLASCQMTATFLRIAVMATAYNLKGDFYNDKLLKEYITNALELMVQAKFCRQSDCSGNWWDWQIGSPIEILKILTLMRGLNHELVDGYIGALRGNVPLRDVLYPGDANDLWLASINVLIGAISNDNGMIERVMRNVNTCFFKYAPSLTRRDGFFRDGSYIMHEYYPYNGSYGVSVLSHIAKIAYLTDKTKVALSAQSKAVLFEWIQNSFIPFIYGGAMLDCVRGRTISRKSEDSRLVGHVAARELYLLSRVFDGKDGDWLRGVVKHWILTDTHRNIFEGRDQLNNNNSVYFIKELKALLNDDSVVPIAPENKAYIFNEMCRAIVVRDTFCVAIAMHSDKIYNFEVCNGENKKGHHTSSGMTYLYNKDLGQYCDDYWCTVDSDRLAGTTVLRAATNYACQPNGSAIGGGASLDDNLAVCTELMPYGQDLKARKSWFVLQNVIVAVGSDISSNSGEVLTVIENRKLKPDAVITDWRFGDGLAWAHLSNGADIGYCANASHKDLSSQREQKRGKWSDINGMTFEDEQECKNEFLLLNINNGINPECAGYSYYILPDLSREQTQSFACKPEVELLVHSEKVHSVRHKKQGLTAVNFFEAGECRELKLSADAPACVIIKERGELIEIAVASPELRQSLSLCLDYFSGEVVSTDKELIVNNSSKIELLAQFGDKKVLKAVFRKHKYG